MKTAKYIILGFFIAFAFSSCDNMIGLGEKLDLNGPEVSFTSPPPRKTIQSGFWLEGKVSDYRSISKMVIKAEKNGEKIPRQWQNKDGKWQISDDYGSSWSSFSQAKWEGEAPIIWKVYIDLEINGIPPEDGEYMFSVQAWDKGELSDDNSYKTLILIIDNDPPKVTVFDPVLYDRSINYDPVTEKFDDKELEDLRVLTDWRNPELIGKFLTSSFLMQWAIEDNFNIWSFDLRFYEMSEPVDNNPATPLSDNYIYRFYQNTPPPPDVPAPENYLKPNGSVTIPALSSSVGNYYGGELKKSITDKTIIRIVTVCYDAANNVTQEKTVGYLIYWPQADIPWITYSSDDLKEPEYYKDHPSSSGKFSDNLENAFLIYPGRDIKAIAFHTQGVKKVTFSLYQIEPVDTYEDSDEISIPEYINKEKENPPRGNNNTYSTNFSWDFRPPPRSGFYVVKANALSISGKVCESAVAVFKVQDITFPDFPEPIQPPELEPLFKHINQDSITISGVVSDATDIASLCLVWINPQSKNAAANAQLEYFRDQDYPGWKQALTLSPGGAPADESAAFPHGAVKYPYDEDFPNKLWQLDVTKSTKYKDGINPVTQRVEYNFSKTIPLSDLNIGIGKQPLKSQVFLLRAANKNPRVTIVTYTPQGDEAPPVIKITNAVINGGDPLTPGAFGQISKLKNNDKITINGTWNEDSIGNLPFDTYLRNNFEISINQTKLTTITFNNNGSGGTWQVIATVKENSPFGANDVPLTKLKDTLVVAANLTDIGNNHSDDGASWLIESDTLRLVRISSEDPDQAYKEGSKIKIFLEFNKPVKLKEGIANPSLTLRVGSDATITAAYESNPKQDTRQYFIYTVANGQNTTTANPYLDVVGLNTSLTGTYWTASTYPFTWESVSATSKDEIRITMNAAHTSANNSSFNPTPNETVLLRRLPVATNTDDLPYTLARGKNISIDTTGPSVSGVGSGSKAGHYALGSAIDIIVKFQEPVKINEAAPPQLRLQLSGKTVDTTGTPKVNGSEVTFSYTVGSGDTTGDNKLTISSFIGGQITDIAGTNMIAYTFNSTNGALNGGTSNGGTGIYVNTVAPGVPTFRALASSANTDIISNTINGSPVTGDSGSTKDLKNYYGDNLYFAIMPNTTGGNNRVGYFEYTLDPLSVTDPTLMNWKRLVNTDGTDNTNGTAFKQDIYGTYIVRTRQIDKAGNPSSVSPSVSINWDPGDFVTRIDSSTPNGDYTSNSVRHDQIKITVYFRKKLNVTGTPVITLNAIRGTGGPKVTVDGSAANTDELLFTYTVANNDNTPGTSYLNVDAFNITAADSDGVSVTNLIKLPADAANRLGNRKEIKVITSDLSLSGTNPAYSFTAANDEATGTITLTFNRNISKRDGTITVTQETAGYRLPAVLTEAQASRYKSAEGFNTYYTRGTNGFVNNAVDTTAKYVLNYEETTVVTPNNAGTAQQKLAYAFHQAEKVTLSVSSQDVTVNGNKLIITLTGSNALQVLGANYDIAIPVGLVQDSLSYQWPTVTNYTATTPANTVPGINRPFVRVDKKINADRITATTNGGSATRPYLTADFSKLIQTRARLDCRTPDSIVRYAAEGKEHTASAANSLGSGPQNPAATPNTPANYYWKNTNDNADNLTNLNGVAQQTVAETGTGGTNYNSFTESSTTHITVGTTNEEGYVWRISVRSRNGATGGNNSALYEEIAFRTVLTYEVAGMNTGGTPALGQQIGSGDQLWIRGGDAIGSSSISGFPLNWQDDYGKLNTEKRRAGIRLMKLINTPATNLYTAANWRYITWETNVQTFHDVVLGRGAVAGTAQDENDAWQYGPRQWAYQRGGWTALKDQYTLIPGKHRWCRITTQNYDGGSVNFSLQFSTRGAQTVTYTQP
jgi:hypothetical protein